MPTYEEAVKALRKASEAAKDPNLDAGKRQEAENAARRLSKIAKGLRDKDRGSIWDPFSQGFTFGGYDEAAALGSSMMGDESYDEALVRKRQDLEAYRERHPWISTATEIGGAAIPTLATLPFAAAGVAGAGMGLTARAILGALLGGTEGGVYGFLSGEGGAGNRLENAGKTATIGGAVGAAAPFAVSGGSYLVGKGAELLRAPKAPSVPGMSRPAANRVVGSMGDDALQTPAELAASRQRVGPHGKLYNMGPNLQADAEALAQTPGRHMKIIGDAATTQQRGATQRVRDLIDDTMGTAENFARKTQDAITARRTKADALYNQAWKDARPVDISDALDYIDNAVKPGINKALPEGKGIVEDSIESNLLKARQYLTNARDKAQRVEPKALHSAKRNIYRMKQQAWKRGDGELAKELQAVEDRVVKSLDEATRDKSGVSWYENARKIYRGDSEVLDALEDGTQVFERKYRAGQLELNLERMSDAEKYAFIAGARDNVSKMMDTVLSTSKGSEAAQAAWKRLLTTENQEKMRLLFGKDRTDRIIRFLRQEQHIGEGADTILRNSATARRLAAQKRIPASSRAMGEPNQSLWSLIERGLRGGARHVAGSVRKGAIDRQNTEVARALAASADDPLLDALMRRQVTLNTRRGVGQAVDDNTRRLLEAALMKGRAPAATAAWAQQP